MTAPSTALEWALALASRGWYVLPIWPVTAEDGAAICACPRGADCKTPGKHPLSDLIQHGQHGATRDPDVIAWWFSLRPDANIAIPLRHRERCYVAFDLDGYKGDDERLAQLENDLDELPQTVVQLSGSHKAHHLIFSVPEDFVAVGAINEITIRGRNYIVVAPSLHASGNCYEWLLGCSPLDIEPAPLPEKWLEAMRRRGEVGEVGVPERDAEPPRLRAVDDNRRIADWAEHVAREDGEVHPGHATEANKHRIKQGKFFVVACSLRRWGVRDPQAALEIMRGYSARCVPPYDDMKVARAVEQAYEYSHMPWGSEYTTLQIGDIGRRARERAAARPAATPPADDDEDDSDVVVTDAELRAHFGHECQRLGRGNPTKRVASDLIARVVKQRREFADGDETLSEATARVASALVRYAPPGTTGAQLAMLIASKGAVGVDVAAAAVAEAQATPIYTLPAPAEPEDPEAEPYRFTPEGAIRWMNERYLWIEELGTVARTDGERLQLRKLEGFRTSLANRQVELDGERAPIAQVWIASPGRRECSRIGLWAPPRVAPPKTYNLWRGFAISPAEQSDAAAWAIMREHIRAVICDGNAELDEYVIRWLAWTVQNPGLPAEVALVLHGDEGIGKGMLGNTLLKIFGPHAVHVTNPNHFVGGKFNVHMRDCAFFFADECFWAGDRSHEGELKGMITEPTMRIEPKGVDSFEVENALTILIASNNDWVVPAGVNARRFVVSRVSDARRKDFEYFAALKTELDGDGASAMLRDLLDLQLPDDWHPRQIVETEALQEQKDQTLAPEDEWVSLLLDEGHLPAGPMARGAAPGWAQTETLLEHARDMVSRLKNVSPQKLSRALRRAGAEPRPHGKNRVRGWQFPPLAEARAAWSAARYKRRWSAVGEWS